MNCLLVVESPAKAKTIAGYLKGRGEHWTVLATRGHIADLPVNELGISERNGAFAGDWRVDKEKRGLIAEIGEVAARADRVFIGSDDDREGEKISSDVVKYAKIRSFQRITLTEITEAALNSAIERGMRDIDASRVDAQIARRLVDREIGYPMSQLIQWDFRRQGVEMTPRGVGRVISPALHLLVEAEARIENHVPQTYQQLVADYSAAGVQFRLVAPNKFLPEDAALRDQMLNDLLSHPHYVYNYSRKTRDVPPYPPLTTARIQRCAFYLFGFSPDHTMRLAQELYEGVEIASGRHGLITYPRTDSYRLSDEACADLITLLSQELAPDLVLTTRRRYEDRKDAQAAHEAIRPTKFEQAHWPKHVRKFLSADAFKLYEMIWYRTLATQMQNAVYDASEIEVDVNGHRLKARANQRIFAGWEELDGERANASERGEEEAYRYREIVLPAVVIGDELNCIEVKAVENTTRRPQRYGIGRFLTTLDNEGIARPSTLDTIVKSLTGKDYATVHQGFLYVTELGRRVDAWVTEHAPWLNNVEHARVFEQRLDAVETREQGSDDVISEYVDLVNALREALGYIDASEAPPTQEQLLYAKQVAEAAGVPIPAEALTARKSLSAYITANRPARVRVGKCPSCKSGSVIAHEKLYRCDNKQCDFKVWRSRLQGFVKRVLPSGWDDEKLIRELLHRKKTLFEDLRTREEKAFSAYLGLVRDTTSDEWKIDMSNPPRARSRAVFS